MAPAPLKVIPPTRDANVIDTLPMANVGPFGMCRSMANPVVASATAASLGGLTPVPCVPMCVSGWIPGDPTNLVQGVPALTRTSILMCSWGGTITIVTDAPG